MASAYQARLWYRASTGCPDSLKPDVARAWFDRSFESVQREHSFRLDRAAAVALSSQPVDDARQRMINENYVRERLRQYARLDAIKRRDLQLALGEAGFTIDAITMATAIETAIETDQTSAQVYRGEGVTLNLLQTDRQFYVTVGRVSPALAARIAERTTADPATIQIIAAESIESEGGPSQ